MSHNIHQKAYAKAAREVKQETLSRQQAEHAKVIARAAKQAREEVKRQMGR